MVCTISPYFTDEELRQTLRMVCPNWENMWLHDWEHILNCIREKNERCFELWLFFGDGTKKYCEIDKVTGGVRVTVVS